MHQLRHCGAKSGTRGRGGEVCREYCFIPGSSLNELRNEYELEIDFALSEKVSLVLASLPSSTRRARAQSNAAYQMFLENNKGSTVRVMSSVMAPRPHGYIICSDVVFYNWKTSPRAAKVRVLDIEGDGRANKKGLEVLEMRDQAFLYLKRFRYTVVTLVEEVFSTRRYPRSGYVSERKGRRWARCFRMLTTLALQILRVSTQNGRV